MKKLIFIFNFYLLSQTLSAQVFKVGDVNCNYKNIGHTFTSNCSSFFSSASQNFSIDVDGDLVTDINIISSCNNTPSSNISYNISLNSSSYEFVYQTTSSTGPKAIQNLAVGTQLNNTLNWVSTATYPNYVNSLYWYYQSGTGYVSSGQLVNPFYVGYRKILSNDTIYGWLLMSSVFPGATYSYAFKHTNDTLSPSAVFTNTTTSVCYGGTISLSANPPGGQFSGGGVTGNIFNSAATGSGTKIVYYNPTPNSGYCSNSSTMALTVNPLPAIIFAGAPYPYYTFNKCVNDTFQINVSPSGGTITFTANGLSGNTLICSQTGISTNTLSYSYTDGNGCTGNSYVGINITTCVGINELKNQEAYFKIFPNPNSGEFEIIGEKKVIINITNELGQLIKTIELNPANNFSSKITELQSGVYFIGNKFSRQKIVVIK